MSNYKAVCFGEILWDVLPTGPVPGGAPMNVAYHLQQLGLSSAMISKIGNDEYGKNMLEFMKSKQLPTAFIETDAALPTGIVHARAKSISEMEYDIVYPAAWDAIEPNNEAMELVKLADWFVFGSLAARDERSRSALYKFLEHAPTKVLDINLRPPHYDFTILETLLEKANILKLNEEELEIISHHSEHENSLENKMRAILKKYDLDIVLVTRGDRGAAVLSEKGFYDNNGYKTTIADTIGAGDSFLAGFISRIATGEEIPDALDFACRIGALVASKKGGCPSYEVSETQSLQSA